MPNIEVKVPNIGDFQNVEVIEVLVKEGQDIKKNDALITIESDKSSVEIPSSHDGKITNLFIKVGDKVSEGAKILALDTESLIEDSQKLEEEKPEFLEKSTPSEKQIEVQQEKSLPISYENNNDGNAMASPKARRFARELGVNINDVIGSERNGRVTEDDIKYYVASRSNKITKSETVEIKNQKKISQEYAHSEFGEVEVKDIPRIKKLASTYLMNSWSNIPHVTNHDEADITEMEQFRSSLTDIYTGEKKKLHL